MAKKSTTPTPSDPDTGAAITVDQAKGQARNIAYTEVRNAHPDEWNGSYQRALKARGIDWSPKPTQEELDLQQLDRLVAQYPTQAQQSVINFRQGVAEKDWPGDQGFVDAGVGNDGLVLSNGDEAEGS